MNNLSQKVEVIMLPTDKSSPIGYHFDKKKEGEVNYAPDFGFELFDTTRNFQHRPQHIHLVINDKIYEGDTVLHFNGVKWLIGKYKNPSKTYDETNCVALSPRTRAKKIIATTDPSANIPLIPVSFIKKYVAANGKISIVSVEIEFGACHCKAEQTICNFEACMSDDLSLKLKLNPDNTVIISTEKDSYTPEEVQQKIKDFCKDHPLERGMQIIGNMVGDWWVKTNN